MKAKQINCNLPSKLAEKIRREAVLFNKSLDSICAVAFLELTSLPLHQRRELYRALPAKRMGRKITT